MSVSVPYYFTPVKVRDANGQVRTLVDGFLFTN
jgi:predicted acylesterase/phospholipase RssA